jgi:transposase/transposase-like protein
MVKPGPPDKIAKVLQDIQEVNGRVNVSQLAREAGVPRETLRDARRRLLVFQDEQNQENNEFEANIAHRLIDGRGRNTNRALTDAEERAVVSDLKEIYPHGFNDDDIRHLCHLRQRGLRSKSLSLTQHFITRFKERHSITRSRFIGRTRKKSDPLLHFEEDVEQACLYIDEFTRLSSIIHPSLIVNVDETPAYVKNTPASANHFAYSSQPWQWVRASDRLKITVLAACSADGKMLKSTIVAKGLTTLCENNFAKLSAGTAFLQHTQSGLTTSASFIEWIDHVLIPHTLDQPSVLIIDQYPAHLTDNVRQYLADHNVTMLEVPARGTALLQPLDVGVFGVAKKKIKATYKSDMFLKNWTEPDRWESTVECVRALGRVDQLSVMRGWQLAFPNYIDELKKRNMAYWVDKKPKKL